MHIRKKKLNVKKILKPEIGLCPHSYKQQIKQ